MKRIIITLMLLIGAQAHATNYDVLGSDLETIEWVNVGVGEYHVLWSDIGGVVPPTSAMILQYLMADTTNVNVITYDTSPSGFDGTVIGATWSPYTNGLIHNYDFDGSTDRINAGQVISGYPYTCSSWIKWDSANSSAISFSTGSDGYYFMMGVHASDGLWVRHFDGTVNEMYYDADISGTWHMLTEVSASASDHEMYLDGILVASTNYTENGNIGYDATVIGRTADSTPLYPFNGGMWGSMIYNAALTPSEIWATNRAQAVTLGIASKEAAALSLTPVLDATFNGDTVQDGSENHAVATDNSTVMLDMGKTNAARVFNGSSSYNLFADNAGYDLTASSNFLISAWINADVLANEAGIVAKGLNTKLEYGLITTGAGAISGYIDADGGWSPSFQMSFPSSHWSADTWYHVCFYYDGAGGRLYLNGEEKAESAYTGGINQDDGDMYVGTYFNTGINFDGSIDEPLVLFENIDTNTPMNLFLASEPKFGQLAGIRDESWFDNLVGLYTWNARNSGVSQDYSGNGNHGTDTSVVKTGFNAEMNGSTSEIDCGSDNSLSVNVNTQMTWSAWINPDSDGEADSGRIFDKNDTGGSVGYFHTLFNESGSTVEVLARVYFLGTNAEVSTAGGTIPLDAWSLYTAVFNEEGDNKIKLYLNGELITLDSDTAGTSGISDDTAKPLTIGNRNDPVRTFDGNIDNAMIFDTALTSNQVYNLYNDYPQGGQ